ncbi:motility associated factor glycosyltransferase family protein [Bacillus sp. RG28]|uniref:Motility associated factor glycosyltransferase family protein n=1 Tax=Gottfriedia endophytica TaxID=2820819 RepID=A0A940SI00_9BACI|nr:6-hydroxymethylpterin diphosphokinase MptE-like protein [Gottfriedia endophytica]MBP0726737.1 motility associated factor glycosyltransferase family protein [Gottfriedia endophytica]
MSFIDQNINLLSKNPNHWIGKNNENDSQTLFINRDNSGNEFLFKNNEIFKIRETLDESQKPNNLKRELIFAIGINSFEEINSVYQTMSKESYLIIIEPNISLFNYALHQRDLSIFQFPNIIVFADDLINLPFFLDNLLSTNLIFYIKNIRLYLTDSYKNFEEETNLFIVKKITETVKYKAMVYGNSIEDSLTGFKHNMRNIKQLARSKNVASLKGAFKDLPAIVVAAGPSLNKNISYLKTVKDKAIIIAVDTISSRLLEEGIVPDFICSIEREKDTYTYFYENKNYPKETTLVGPLLLYPKIFDEFKGDLIIPMRKNVGEYLWLQETLNLRDDNTISIGLSCAHVAFGFAEHIGASPIILVGQDLAFGVSKEESHAGGTIYDDKNFTNDVFSKINELKVDGYYGKEVTSTDIWINFRKWFEKEILDKKLFVINSTEGGAKIANTIQKDLKDVIEEYCIHYISPVKEVIDSTASYPITIEQMKQSLDSQIEYLSRIKKDFESQLNKLKKLKIYDHFNQSDLLKVLNKLNETDRFFDQIKNNWLLRHNLQPMIMTTVWNLFDIEQVLSANNLKRNKELQVEFLTVSVFVMGEILAIIEKSLKNIN